MIPISSDFVSQRHHIPMRMTPLQTGPTSQNIASIAYLGLYPYNNATGVQVRNVFRVTLAAMTSTDWSVGMKVTIAGTLHFHGIWEIKVGGINTTNKTIDIYCPGVDKSYTGCALGTALTSGLSPQGDFVPGIEVYNNNGELIGYSYDTEGAFLIYCTSDIITFQIWCHRNATHTIDFTIKQSLIPVYDSFNNFSSPISSIGANTEVVTIIWECKNKWILIETDNLTANGYYMVLMGV